MIAAHSQTEGGGLDLLPSQAANSIPTPFSIPMFYEGEKAKIEKEPIAGPASQMKKDRKYIAPS